MHFSLSIKCDISHSMIELIILAPLNIEISHLNTIVYSAAHTAVCSAFQEGTNAILNIIPGDFNLKVWFLSLLINPFPVYLQAKDFIYQNRVISPFEWFDMPLHLYTLNSL